MKKNVLLLGCSLFLMLASCSLFNEVKDIGSNELEVQSRAIGDILINTEAENMTLGGSYASIVSSPFDGVALYGGSDFIESEVNISIIPGEYLLEVTGASNNSSTAEASLYIDDKKMGTLYFTGETATISTLDFVLQNLSLGNHTIKLISDTDNGSWDVIIDSVKLTLTGISPEPPAAPIVPTVSVWESREYRNLFVEWGKTEAEVSAKIDDLVGKFFYGEDGGGWQIYQEVGSDMAYIDTVDTDDVRSEGMSYGMMVCVQLDMKTEFDKLWNWTKTYMQHQTGDRQGYFAWQVSKSGNIMDQNPAPDGEEYFAMALFFAGNRWGNGSGIYNYEAEANEILDDMIRHKQKRGLTSWNGSAENMIDEDEKQIVLSTIGSSSTYTDPSYHLPHFYELFHRMADPSLISLWEAGEDADGDIGARNGITWLEMADVSRQLFQNTTNSTTGLAPAYSDFDGTPNASNPGVKSDKFSYDSWRVAGNIAQDYLWFKKDSWQKDTWAKNYLDFFYDEGVISHGNLYELNGTQISSDHSVGLVAMNAVAATIYEDQKAWAFIEELWNITPTEGTYRYYDGCLYLFGMLNVSGRYRIYDGESTNEIPEVPVAPGNLSAISSSSNQIDLSWSDNSDNERGFKVERSTDNVNWSEIGTITSNTTTYGDSGLTAETLYYYRVRSHNSGGNSEYTLSVNAITDPASQVDPVNGIWVEAEDFSADYYNLTVQDGYVSGISYSHWLQYTGLELSGNTFTFRYSLGGSGGYMDVRLDHNDASSSIAKIYPVSTGSWDTWEEITVDISEVSGTHTLYFYFHDTSNNIRLDKFIFGSGTGSEIPVEPEEPVVIDTDWVEAEEFDSSYYNLQVRDGYVYNISYSHWLQFNSVEISGNEFKFRYAKGNSGGYMDVRIDSNDSSNSIATIYPDSTGGWDNWEEVTVTIPEVSGSHIIYLYFHNSSDNIRLDKFKF